MSFDHSCIIIVPVASHADLEVVFCAWGKSELPGYSFTAALGALVEGPVTHYGCNDQQTNEEAAHYLALPTDSGTLPPALTAIDWSIWGITEVRAKAACAAAKVWVSTGVTGAANFTQAKSELGLVDIV